MNAADLIKFLQTLPADTEVFVPYESDDDTDPCFVPMEQDNLKAVVCDSPSCVGKPFYGKTRLRIKASYPPYLD